MGLVAGQLVYSRRGRDVGRVYVVLGQAEERVLLCDGIKHTKQKPKKKNPLHIMHTNTVLDALQLQSDVSIKRAIKEYMQKTATAPKGG